MKKGDIKCAEFECNNCPFGTKDRLRLCTGFKLEQTLFSGLETIKEHMDNMTYKRIKANLEKEI